MKSNPMAIAIINDADKEILTVIMAIYVSCACINQGVLLALRAKYKKLILQISPALIYM